MANYNKIIYGGQVLIDLTADTITADKLAKDVTAHDKSGAIIAGTSTKDVDSTDATVAEAEILNGKTAYARGTKLTGTMPNRGAVAGEIKTGALTYTVPQGYHDGSGTVTVSENTLIASNIREGITILGVEGTMSSSEGMNGQSKTVTPTKLGFTVNPDSGYNCLTSVTVNAVPYVETPNAAGGTTVTIL